MLVAAGFGIGLWLASLGGKDLIIPKSIKEEVSFPIYVPGRLPGNYQVNADSFTLNEATLIFSATDAAGSRIVFTEQPRPQDFNFDTFYKEQLKDPEILSDVPFPSVVGKTKEQTMVLSIVTPETWIMASTNSPLGVNDLKTIAEHVKRHR